MERAVSRLELVLLGAAIVVGLAIRLHFYTGLIASDDLTHGYAAAHFFHPGPQDMQRVPGMSTNVRRIGVNLPLFLAGKIAGFGATTYAMVPLLFSLAGIVIIFAVARRLGGPLAGLAAAWMWAVLPADIYTSTVWLQDNIYATVLAGFLALFVAAELGDRHRRFLAFAAGLVLGYLPYVKASGFVLGLPMVVWVVWTCVRARRIEPRVLWMTAGFTVMNIPAMVYFWALARHPLLYVTGIFVRWSELAGPGYHTARPFPANVVMLGHYLLHDWVLGYAVVFAPVLLVFALLARRLPVRLRVFLGLVFLVELWALVTALILGSWTQRYVLQISAPVVLLAALGLAEAVERCGPWLARLPSWMRTAVGPAAATILVLATGTALSAERQQFRHDRTVVVTDAYHYLEAVAAPDEAIYVSESQRVPNYTLRALKLLSGYRPFKGGLRPLAEAYSATGGWVVLDNRDFAHRPKDEMYRGIPPNWLEVYRSETHHGHFYARVFRILRAAPPVTVKVVRRRDTPPALDLSTLPLSPVPLDGPADAFLGKRWTHGADVTLRRSARGGIVESIHPTCKKRKRAFSALQLPVRGLDAISFDLSLSDPTRVHKVFVYGYDAQEKGRLRWSARHPRHGERKGYPRHVVLVDGEHTPPFVHLADSTRPGEVRSVVIGVWLDGCAPAEVEIDNVQVAPPTGPRLTPQGSTMAPTPDP